MKGEDVTLSEPHVNWRPDFPLVHKTRVRPGLRRHALVALAGHDPPADDLLVDLAQAVGDQAAEELEELQGGVGVHGEDLAHRPLIQGQHGERAGVGAGVGRARLAVDQRQLAEEVAALQDGERLLAGAGDELGDHHPSFEDDVHLVPLVPLLKQGGPGVETLLAGEGGEGYQLAAGEPLLAEETDLVRLRHPHVRGAPSRGLLAQAQEALRHRLLGEERLELLVGRPQLARQAVPERPVDLDPQLRGVLHQVVERRGVETEDQAGGGGEGVGAALLASDEARLAEEVPRLDHPQREGAVGGGALDGDLPPFQHVEVALLGAVAEDQAAHVVDLLAHGLGEAEDLLVGEVGEGLDPPQARSQLELAAGVPPFGRRGRKGEGGSRQPPLLQEALAVPLQPVEGDVHHLLALFEDARQLAVAPAQDLLQGLDTPPQPPHPLLVAVVEQQEGVHGGAQRRLELLALVLGPSQALRRLAVEGVVAQRPAEFLRGAVEVAAAEEQTAVQLVVGGVGQVLGLGDLDALDGPRVLPLLGVEVGEPQEVGGVDGVAAEPFAQDVAQAARARPRVLLLELADLRQRQLDAQVLGVQTQGQEEDVRRLLIPSARVETLGQIGQLPDLRARGALRIAHTPRFSLHCWSRRGSVARRGRLGPRSGLPFGGLNPQAFFDKFSYCFSSHHEIPVRRGRSSEMAMSPEMATSVKLGIECCRRGDWNAGLQYLGKVTQTEDANVGLPGLFYSYLGYGIALRDRRIREGLRLCRHSIEVEFYQAENYLNLARTHLLARDRKGAVKAVRAGLKIDRNNPKLLALYKELGIRGSPVLSFLDRKHPINQLLGRVR